MQFNFTNPPHPSPLLGKPILPTPTLRFKLPPPADHLNLIQQHKPSLVVKCCLGDSVHFEKDLSHDVQFEKLQSFLFGSTATINFDQAERVFVATFSALKINVSGFQVYEDGLFKKKTKEVIIHL